MDAEKILDFLAPKLVELGEYAVNQRVNLVSWIKTGHTNDLSGIVSESDIYVQEQILKKLSELKLDISVYGEEKTPYADTFHVSSKKRLFIDPIDGTLAYVRGLDNFCSIVSIMHENELVGALIHTPFDKKTYNVNQNLTNVYDYRLEKLQNLKMSQFDSDIVLAYELSDSLTVGLEKRGLRVHHLLRKGIANPEVEVNSILRGEIGSFLIYKASVLDWAPIAFAVKKVGGIVTDYSGNEIKFDEFIPNPRNPDEPVILNMVASINQKLHDLVLESI